MGTGYFVTFWVSLLPFWRSHQLHPTISFHSSQPIHSAFIYLLCNSIVIHPVCITEPPLCTVYFICRAIHVFIQIHSLLTLYLLVQVHILLTYYHCIYLTYTLLDRPNFHFHKTVGKAQLFVRLYPIHYSSSEATRQRFQDMVHNFLASKRMSLALHLSSLTAWKVVASPWVG